VRQERKSEEKGPQRAEARAEGGAPPQASVPAISLPKGGGAIRGMGEKFGVSPSTGSASLSVPLPSSPGRSGFGPQLSLSYDSGSGNGPFGFGWSLPLPAITRKTDKGLPRYRDGEESDVFILSGAEDLVPVLDAAGRRVSFPRTLHGVAYRVHLYRPRVEGSFARIERWARADGAGGHWRTITRDNVTTLFGPDENSRIFDPSDPGRVFSYLISLTFDDKGNATHYHYAAEDSAGVDAAAAHEAGRTAPGRTAQRYLKRVRHGNAAPYFPDWSEDPAAALPVPEDWHFHLVFDYGDHRADAPTAERDPAADPAWPVRPDPFSTYRAGFEVRTYRRCERVLLFHQFGGRPGFDEPALVRSADFTYSDEAEPADPRNPVYTFLESVSHTGYGRDGDGAVVSRSTPPLEFFYSRPEVREEVLTLADAVSRENLPEGLDGSRFRLVDLDGEGAAGILTEQGGGWGYKRNLSPANLATLPGGGRAARARFGPLERVPSLPAPASLGGGRQLLDLTGEGRADLADFSSAVPGFFARTAEGGWEPLKSFAALPRIDWSEPNLRFVDLTGDGHADALITEEEVYTFYPSLGERGFGGGVRVRLPSDERRGPRVVFADGTQTVSLADISGDGLSDLVRVRNGEVCYWPNLGYGRFGAKVTMDGAPRFTDEERFDPRRIHFADIDGSGTTDLLYVGAGGVQVCFNRSGNSWAEPRLLAVFPDADQLSSVQVADLLGNGTACLVWSSPLPAAAGRSLRYVDLMGGQKPHLLVRTRNNLGAETRVAFAPSTRFYLEDARAGRPWVTRLPFPVHVVERVETYDWVGRSRFVTRYGYHHGYFDGAEREFRGFGMVEQRDTETHRDDTLFPEAAPLNEDAASFSPPVVTRTWFHTGAFVEAGTVSRQYAREYWVEPALRGDTPADAAAREAMLLPDSVIEPPPGAGPPLTAEELREAYRALKGTALRTEVYAEDGSARAGHPYTVTEQTFAVRRVQTRGTNRHAVFLTHRRESVSYNYERRPEDPRVTHDLTLEVDEFGNTRRTAAVGYGRRPGHDDPEPELSPAFRSMLAHDQASLRVVATERVHTEPVNRPETPAPFDAYRGRMTAETITAELTGLTPAAALFRFEELDAHYLALWAGGDDIPYEEVTAADIDGAGAPPAAAGRRIVERVRTHYRSDDLTALLPFRVAESRALTGESYRLALTPGLLSRVFGARVDDATLAEGGYARLPGDAGFWIPSGRVFYSPGEADAPAAELAEARAHFYLVRRAVDPFGSASRVSYDAYSLLPTATADALGNTTLAENDYRVLQPRLSTDPNGVRAAVAYDCLGQVAGTALMGRAGEAAVGDSLEGFGADLPEAVIRAALADPLAAPAALLGGATSRVVYDLLAYFRTRDLPAPDAPTVYTLTRETHAADLPAGGEPRFQHLFTYSDGFGRAAQQKARAERGPVPGVGPDVSPRWVGSGWTIYDNKGQPVRKYEPFFSRTHRFEFARQAGVSSVIFYDPVARAVAVLHPDAAFEKTVFDGWRQETWDAADTVLIDDPRTDPDVGDFFRRLLGDAPGAFVSWHGRRIGGAHGPTPGERAANQDAAAKAEAYAATPGVKHFDALGRTCLEVADNTAPGGAARRFATRTALDVEGKPLAVFDALGRRVVEFCLREPAGPGGGFRYVAGYDVAGALLYGNGMDGGERRTFNAINGSPLRTWEARGFSSRTRYDALRRPTHRFVERPGRGEILAERMVYGERHPEAARNLKGRLFRHYDGAGVVTNGRYDFKGNLTESARQFARRRPASGPAPFYDTTPDWSAVTDVDDEPSLDLAALDAAAAPALSAGDRFTASSRFDALNRVTQTVTPHRAGGRPSVIQPAYNEANLLEHIDVWLGLPAAPAALLDPEDPATPPDLPAVRHVEYNARGQRELMAFGNGAVTTYAYDPETFRLTTLTTTRPGSFAPDARTVQALAYTYDPAGNITRLRDSADTDNVVFFRNRRVEPTADYTYDALYRLVRAEGREHLGQNGGGDLGAPAQVTNDDSFRTGLAAPGDGSAMGNYAERYEYDPVGNVIRMIHEAATGGWTRRYAYAEPSRITPGESGNRLSATSLPGDAADGPYSAAYEHDAHGNMTRMPHLPRMTWDEHDRLQSTTRQSAAAVMPETTYYTYDGGGGRLRKATFRQAALGVTPTIKSERLYLGGFEVYREYDAAGALVKERETLHVSDDKGRVALVETRTFGDDDPAPERLVRYQHTNHLGSALLELDESAEVVTYEEYYPHGPSSYQAVRSQTETPKRYRYTGKERDEENDLYYHGARYYAPWLGRWTACDPAGLAGGVNLYLYVRGNPVRLHDPTGLIDESELATRSQDITNRAAGPRATQARSDLNNQMSNYNQNVEHYRDVRNVESLWRRSTEEPQRVSAMRESLQRAVTQGTALLNEANTLIGRAQRLQSRLVAERQGIPAPVMPQLDPRGHNSRTAQIRWQQESAAHQARVDAIQQRINNVATTLAGLEAIAHGLRRDLGALRENQTRVENLERGRPNQPQPGASSPDTLRLLPMTAAAPPAPTVTTYPAQQSQPTVTTFPAQQQQADVRTFPAQQQQTTVETFPAHEQPPIVTTFPAEPPTWFLVASGVVSVVAGILLMRLGVGVTPGIRPSLRMMPSAVIASPDQS